MNNQNDRIEIEKYLIEKFDSLNSGLKSGVFGDTIQQLPFEALLQIEKILTEKYL